MFMSPLHHDTTAAILYAITVVCTDCGTSFFSLHCSTTFRLPFPKSKLPFPEAQLVLLEAPVLPYNEGAPSFSEVIAFMAAHHFELVDVADATYSEAPGGVAWRRLPSSRGSWELEMEFFNSWLQPRDA